MGAGPKEVARLMSKKPAKSRPSGASARGGPPRREYAAKPRGPPGATKRPAKAQAMPAAAYQRIAEALEAIVARLPASPDSAKQAAPLAAADAFVWHPSGKLIPVPRVNRVELSLLKGIDRMRDILIENTERFATGLPANNALLWGARGMGKSSLVKAVHASINVGRKPGRRQKLIEIHREDIETLPQLMALLRGATSALSCSATIYPSTVTMPPTSRSRPCSKAVSRAAPTM